MRQSQMFRNNNFVASFSIFFSVVLLVCSLSFLEALNNEIVSGFDFANEKLVWIKSQSETKSFFEKNSALTKMAELLPQSFLSSDLLVANGVASSTMLSDKNSAFVSIYGVGTNFFDFINLDISNDVKNDFLLKNNSYFPSCLLDDQVHKYLFKNELPNLFEVNGIRCNVVGVYKPFFSLPDLSFNYSVLVHYNSFFSLTNAVNKVEPIKLILRRKPYNNMAIQGIINAIHEEGQFTLVSANEILELKSKVTDSLAIIFVLFVGTLLFISCSMLSTSKLLDVNKREGEFGLKVALGASKLNVATEVIVGAVKDTLYAGISGLICGAFVTEYLLKPVVNGFGLIKEAQLSVDYSTVIFVLAVLVIIAVIASFYPCKRALNVDPSVTMRRL